MVATAVPKMPAERMNPVSTGKTSGPVADEIGGEQRGGDDEGGSAGGLETDGDAGDDVGRRAGPGRLGDLLHRAVACRRVVLRDEDERERGDDTDHAAEQELDLAVRQHPEAHQDQSDDGQGPR